MTLGWVLFLVTAGGAFALAPLSGGRQASQQMHLPSTTNRRNLLLASSIFGNFFFGSSDSARAKPTAAAIPPGANGPTNEVIKNVRGMKQRRLGGSDIVVSELGLGSQRWVSTDFNAPNEDLCFAFMDRAILENGVNLIDTAEQYPIPSDGSVAQEGDTERVIGKWMKDRKVARDKVVIATKITGGRNVTPKNIKSDCMLKSRGNSTVASTPSHSCLHPNR